MNKNVLIGGAVVVGLLAVGFGVSKLIGNSEGEVTKKRKKKSKKNGKKPNGILNKSTKRIVKIENKSVPSYEIRELIEYTRLGNLFEERRGNIVDTAFLNQDDAVEKLIELCNEVQTFLLEEVDCTDTTHPEFRKLERGIVDFLISCPPANLAEYSAKKYPEATMVIPPTTIVDSDGSFNGTKSTVMDVNLSEAKVNTPISFSTKNEDDLTAIQLAMQEALEKRFGKSE